MNIEIIDLPQSKESSSNSIGIADMDFVPFAIKRVYFLYDIPTNSRRGGHSHKEQHEFLIAIKGSFDVLLNDGKETQKIHLNKPNKGLWIKENIWRELENFSQGSVCLVMASAPFEEADYVRDLNVFLEKK